MNELDIFKNKHSGETVVLVGNGPSLAKTNLDLIKKNKIPSIAMNRINLIFNSTSWRPTYYLYASSNIYNEHWGDRWKSSVNYMIESKTACFIWKKFENDLITNLKKFENVYWFEAKDFIKEWKRKRFKQKILEAIKIYFPSLAINDISMSSKVFSKNPNRYLSKFGTSMLIAYQLAHFMDFSKIILVGCDLNWQTSRKERDNDPNHFAKNYGANISFGKEDSILVKYAHSLAKKYFDIKNVEIINASINSELNVFKKEKLSNILKK